MNFIDKDYSIPTEDKYMKFVQGENKFRMLCKPIMGQEYWKDVEIDGKSVRKPIRKRTNEKIDISDVPEPEKIKHFWATVVYNYQDKKVQVLQITQKTIQRSILAMARSEDWGSPKHYDISVTRTGEKLETEYSVMPCKPKDLEDGIMRLYKDMNINLEALYVSKEEPYGGDPFAVEKITDKDLDEIAKQVK